LENAFSSNINYITDPANVRLDEHLPRSWEVSDSSPSVDRG
jgi:hypothetical protein